MPDTNNILVHSREMQEVFERILTQYGFQTADAANCAEILTNNSIDGIYTHGVNRFPKFIEYIRNGYIRPGAKPSLTHKLGGLEQWEGHFGPGPLNAMTATHRAMELAETHGIGCVALANTNHWMRAGTYGWEAAKKGFAFICWTNTIGNMPAWGAADARMGNNPLVFAIPFRGEAIIVDTALSQYSFGAMEQAAMKQQKLAVTGGYDTQGNLTDDPAAILETRRPLPIGYWKGAGLSLLLDMMATILSGGLATHEITAKGIEYCSQVFIAFDIRKLGNASSVAHVMENIIADYQQSIPATADSKITYPGQRVLQIREQNRRDGIPVIKKIWEEILLL
jgi:3-dehydro-L-gulonate 2-dehydrogenase